MTLAPCVPALAAVNSCRMSGCEPATQGGVAAPDCCCGVANSPALPGAPATLLSNLLSKMTHAQPASPNETSDTGDGPARTLAAFGIVVEPPAHVPLFLLHSTLLI